MVHQSVNIFRISSTGPSSGVDMLWFTSQVQPTTCFSKENVMGTKSHSFIYVLSMATCVLKLQSSVVKNETI